MEIIEKIIGALLVFIGGAGAAALINGWTERWKFRANRKAAKEDRAEERADITDELQANQEKLSKTVDEILEQQNAQSEALKLILLDRILHLGSGYIHDGSITLDDRARFHAMHKAYHNGLHGNGDADLIVAAVDELPLKTR